MKETFGFDPEKFFTWVSNMPAPLLAVIGVLMVGFALKRTKKFPNDFIPLLLVVVVGPALLLAARFGVMRFVVEGMVYAGLVWLAHGQLWKRFAPRFLGEHSRQPFEDDTQFLSKSDVQPASQPESPPTNPGT